MIVQRSARGVGCGCGCGGSCGCNGMGAVDLSFLENQFSLFGVSVPYWALGMVGVGLLMLFTGGSSRGRRRR